jgi:acetyltransferase-like isoleucine patch superfamily enzyme
VKNLFLNLAIFLLPIPGLRRSVIRWLGNEVADDAKVGLSLLIDTHLHLAPGSRIRSFSFFKGVTVTLQEGASIGFLNVFKGYFDILLGEDSSIGNICQFKNGGQRLMTDRSTFSIGSRSNVTSAHYFDLSANIQIGNGTVIGGRGSSFWTHGFLHFAEGSIRVLNTSPIVIGNGVYIGGFSSLNPGTRISDNINIGSHSSVAGSLEKPGLYVSERLRYIPLGDYETFKQHNTLNELDKSGNPKLIRNRD